MDKKVSEGSLVPKGLNRREALKVLGAGSASIFLSGNSTHALAADAQISSSKPTKLHWFIPDGVRADPDLFKVFQWAKEGKLPNIKRMMELGSYGYSTPVFPSHTPTNFAALLTGTYPVTNGIADGPMRIEGKPLLKPSVAGFSSTARTVPAIWSEFSADKRIVLVSLPGSTPTELKNNAITIRGRWGGWGADFHSVIFEKKSISQRKKLARNSKLFFQGMELTQYIDPIADDSCSFASGVENSKCLKMSLYGTTLFARLISNSKNGNDQKFDTMMVSRDGRGVDAILKKGEWSQWLPLKVTWNGRTIDTNIRFNLISTGARGFFRIRVLIDNLNTSIVEPSSAATALESDIGPMVDFVDNFPPQLVYYPEDKKTFLDESKMSFAWHLNSVDAIYKRYHPDVFIHDIYSPNQMLTSKWWMGHIDPKSIRYNEVTEAARSILWSEVLDMYKDLDKIIGKTLDNADENTLVVFSSDHGAVPLDQSVQLNNLFAKKGWITYSINLDTGEHIIDWEKSKVVFLKMSNVYINPKGLGPNYNRISGDEYEQLRNEVIETIQSLKDSRGICPLELAVKWEDADTLLKLPANRIGDIVIANKPGFGWSEDITEGLEIFTIPLESGYKQAILADKVKGMWAPFIIVGKGIKKNYEIKKRISNVDQAPTILRALGMSSKNRMDGVSIDEVFE